MPENLISFVDITPQLRINLPPKIFTQPAQNLYEILFFEMVLYNFPLREACKAVIKNRIYAGIPEPRSL